ncbi:hypothetical protein SAMN05444374_10187 [Rhodococcoides kroppenstedtii]|uniref:Uncharacterized protein n=1 Tax=Rhodococcoides kroppenstedtii TaxID=293050 RepID=A0A1I0SFC9_9NOCA|nr:hypothetical protein [Rhodococcus kroppenstedtii]SFA38200.1 hypothetical protein SAMN05444374_10187 [Rhodococcus kroppenstedtii]
MKRVWIGLAAIVLAGCGSAATEPTAPTTTTRPAATTNPYPLPAYDYVETRDGYISAFVNKQLTDDELSRIFYNLKSWYTTQDKEGGWFVQINCGTPDGPRLANGKFALDNLGAAQTGLAGAGAGEFAPLDTRQPCNA